MAAHPPPPGRPATDADGELPPTSGGGPNAADRSRATNAVCAAVSAYAAAAAAAAASSGDFES